MAETRRNDSIGAGNKMTIGLQHYLILSAVLFCIGLFGALTRKNAVVILMCIELMLNAVNISLVAFSSYIVPLLLTGQIFAIFVIVVAAAEIAVGLAIVLAIYRGLANIDTNNINLLKW
jgi:NAD(P)H-quinone oxidoreductase subunit 4L